MEVDTGSAAEAVVEWSRRIARTALDEQMAREYGWFARLIEEKKHQNNYQFFNWLAARPEAEGLLRWCLYVLKESPELHWVCAEARSIFQAPTSRQPHLLKIVEEFE